MENKNKGIYIILNLVNNKSYIGSTVNFKTRRKQHLRVLKRKKHHSSHLQYAFDKYGEDNFVFAPIEFVENKEDLITRETYWIEVRKSLDRNFGYNMRSPVDSHLNFKSSQQVPCYLICKKSNKILVKVDSINLAKATKENNPDIKIVRVKSYDPNFDYRLKKYIPKVKKVRASGYGKPIESFDLTTLETVIQYKNSYEASLVLGCTRKSLGKILCGERKSYRGLGYRYLAKSTKEKREKMGISCFIVCTSTNKIIKRVLSKAAAKAFKSGNQHKMVTVVESEYDPNKDYRLKQNR